jgi:hypothetical protein
MTTGTAFAKVQARLCTIGKLGLSEQKENSIVAFLKTLTDGYMHVAAPGDAIGASIGSISRDHPP